MVTPESKRAIFYGDSMDYEFAIDRDHLDKIRSQFPDWTLEYNL